MTQNRTQWAFAENKHPENTDHHTTFAPTLHMVNNPCGLVNGSSIPVYITEKEFDGTAIKTWKI